MDAFEAYLRIREACLRRPDLRYKDWKPDLKVPGIDGESFQGFCYIASHAFALVVPDARVFAMDNGMHYWNKIGDKIWDLTVEQFKYPFVYDGHRVNKRTTNRVEELLKEADLWW